MAAQGIEYAGPYTSDMRSTVDYFVRSIGFTPMAECAEDGSRSLLLRHGTVQLVVTAAGAPRSSSRRTESGIADIAFGCDDPAQTCARAVVIGYPKAISFAPGRPYDGFFDTEQIFTHVRRHLDYLAERGTSPEQIRAAMFQYGPTAG